jgi:predicted Zn-ribbon and HTH transcriptional regulator
MIWITKRGAPSEHLMLVHQAVCTPCGTEYEFTVDEAQKDGGRLKTSCPVCKRDVFSADGLGQLRRQPIDPPFPPPERSW